MQRINPTREEVDKAIKFFLESKTILVDEFEVRNAHRNGEVLAAALRQSEARAERAGAALVNLRGEIVYLAEALEPAGNLWDWRGFGEREDLQEWLSTLAQAKAEGSGGEESK